jgi:hypothetical protein
VSTNELGAQNVHEYLTGSSREGGDNRNDLIRAFISVRGQDRTVPLRLYAGKGSSKQAPAPGRPNWEIGTLPLRGRQPAASRNGCARRTNHCVSRPTYGQGVPGNRQNSPL